MTTELFIIRVLALIGLVQTFILLNLRLNILTLKTALESMVGKHMLLVRSLGLAEGNVEGIASQVAKQDKIDQGELDEAGTQDITGVIKGVVKPKKVRAKAKEE